MILRNPFYSVLALIGHLVSLAILFLLLQAEFLAAAQIVVYAGAIMVLYLFVTAYVGGAEPWSARAAARRAPSARSACFMAGALFVVIAMAVMGSSLGALDTRAPTSTRLRLACRAIGELLLQKFLIPFEAASFLLLVAAVCAVMLARRRRGLEDDGEAARP